MAHLKKLLLTSVISITSVVCYAHDEPIKADVEIELKEVYGRSASEYFFTPFIGLAYNDITGISNSFFEPDVEGSQIENINVTKTELGGVFGLFFDGQYQIMATDYWRAGFQTGFFYTSPMESEFTAETCSPTFVCSPEKSTLKVSSWDIPVLFTLSRYAAKDRYILTFKVGPTVSFQKYKADLDGFELQPTSESQLTLSVGIDGRYRIGKSDNFLLAGFLVDGLFGNNNNSDFSGVDTSSELLFYIGYSFS